MIEWQNLAASDESGEAVRFQAVLHENGELWLQYLDTGRTSAARGGAATLGIENFSGDDALQISLNDPWLIDGTAIRFFHPAGAFVEGVASDPSSHVRMLDYEVRDLGDGRQAQIDNQGRYRLWEFPGLHRLEVRAAGRFIQQVDVNVDAPRERVRFLLPSAAYIVLRETVEEQLLVLNNPTGAPLPFELAIEETGEPARGWLSVTPSVGVIPAGGQAQVIVRANAVGLPRAYYPAWLLATFGGAVPGTAAVKVELWAQYGPYPYPSP